MKKSNRLASLFLAMLMALSCMAVPAMAAGNDGIMPHGPLMHCGGCGQWIELRLRDRSPVTCYCNSATSKPHNKIVTDASYSCSCGHSDNFVYRTICG